MTTAAAVTVAVPAAVAAVVLAAAVALAAVAPAGPAARTRRAATADPSGGRREAPEATSRDGHRDNTEGPSGGARVSRASSPVCAPRVDALYDVTAGITALNESSEARSRRRASQGARRSRITGSPALRPGRIARIARIERFNDRTETSPRCGDNECRGGFDPMRKCHG